MHVRRGDYLKPDFEGLSKCCPNDYFERAIQYMKEHMDTPVFYVFSDDMDYVKENIKLEDAFYIDGNRE